jgi:addiction module HigA family antidote
MIPPQIPYPTNPGEMLVEEFLKPMELSQSELARCIGTTPRAINEICLGKRAISPLMAIRLANYFGNTSEFWLNLQMAWDLWREWEKFSKKSRSA